jgi:hypothetical protein
MVEFFFVVEIYEKSIFKLLHLKVSLLTTPFVLSPSVVTLFFYLLFPFFLFFFRLLSLFQNYFFPLLPEMPHHGFTFKSESPFSSSGKSGSTTTTTTSTESSPSRSSSTSMASSSANDESVMNLGIEIGTEIFYCSARFPIPLVKLKYMSDFQERTGEIYDKLDSGIIRRVYFPRERLHDLMYFFLESEWLHHVNKEVIRRENEQLATGQSQQLTVKEQSVEAALGTLEDALAKKFKNHLQSLAVVRQTSDSSTPFEVDCDDLFKVLYLPMNILNDPPRPVATMAAHPRNPVMKSIVKNYNRSKTKQHPLWKDFIEKTKMIESEYVKSCESLIVINIECVLYSFFSIHQRYNKKSTLHRDPWTGAGAEHLNDFLVFCYFVTL